MTICKTELFGKTSLIFIYLRCNVDRLKLMRKPLPRSGELSHVWQDIGKVIDPLHISNHKVTSVRLLQCQNQIIYVEICLL